MQGTNMQGANMQSADMRGADMRGANMRGTNMQDADMRGANIDYSAWQLSCRSLNVKVCDKIAAQLLFHAFAIAKINPTDEQIEFIKNFHKFDECGGIAKLTSVKEENK